MPINPFSGFYQQGPDWVPWLPPTDPPEIDRLAPYRSLAYPPAPGPAGMVATDRPLPALDRRSMPPTMTEWGAFRSDAPRGIPSGMPGGGYPTMGGVPPWVAGLAALAPWAGAGASFLHQAFQHPAGFDAPPEWGPHGPGRMTPSPYENQAFWPEFYGR